MPAEFVPEGEYDRRPLQPLELPPRPPANEIFDASLRQGNWMVQALTRLHNSPLTGFAPVDGYNAWDEIKANPLWTAHAGEFGGSRSPEQTRSIGARIDQDDADRKTIGASGGLGVVAGAYSGLMDPVMLFPGSIAIGALKEGIPIVRGALQTAAGAATQSSISETFLQMQHPERPVYDSIVNVGSATVAGAVLGGAASALSPVDRVRLPSMMDVERARMDAHVTGAPPPPGMPPATVKPEALGDTALGRLMQSDSPVVQRAARDISEHATLVEGSTEGKPSTLSGGPPLETMADTEQAVAATRLHDTLTDAWTRHNLEEKAEGGEPVTFEQFNELVGDAMMAGDRAEHPQIERAAKEARSTFDAWSARAEKADPDFKPVEPQPGEGSFPRLWDKPTIVSDRATFEARLTDHLAANQGAGEVSAAPKKPTSSALENFTYDDATSTMEITFKSGKTYIYEGVPKEEFDKLANAPSHGKHFNQAIKRAGYKFSIKDVKAEVAKPVESDLSVEALRARATKITDDILATPDGQISPDIGVSNAWAHDWVHRDVEKVAAAHMRTVVPDTLMAERHGDAAATGMVDAVKADYERLIAEATSDSAKARLEKRRDADLADLAILSDNLRGTHAVSPEAPVRNIGNVVAAVQALANLPKMGFDALQSIPEMAAVISHWGLETTFKDAWQPLLRSLMTDEKLAGEAARQAEVMGLGLKAATAPAPHIGGSPFETTLQAGADPMQLVKMIQPQIDVLRTAAGVTASTGIYRASKAAAAGTATEAQLRALEAAAVPESLWGKIAEQYEASGTTIDNVMLPNTEKWTQETRGPFEAAVQRDVNLSGIDPRVDNPGLDSPGFLHGFVLGAMNEIKAFFGATGTEISKANLTRSQAQWLQRIVTGLALGLLQYKLTSILEGKRTSSDPLELIKASIEHGPLLGLLGEGTKAARMVERGVKGVDLFRSIGGGEGKGKGKREREQERTQLDQIVGPTTMNKLEDIPGGHAATTPGGWTPNDVIAKRRLTATQRLYELNRVLTGASHNLGHPAQ